MNEIILSINGYLWGLPMIAFLFFTHLVMSWRSRFIQRKVFTGIRLSVTNPMGVRGDISPFQALSTSLASTLGTGNIIGVGTAVAMGGAGAVFWCWVTGIFGMATQYAECLLAVRYRMKASRGYTGGPMYVLEKGVGSRSLGMVYAFVAAVCGLLTGAAIQTNAISNVVTASVGDKDRAISLFGKSFSLTGVAVGIAAAVLTALVVFGGIKVIGRVCQLFVPFMAVTYILGCFAVLIINRHVLLQTLWRILTDAFSFRAAAGGVTGSVMMAACRFGMARGLFSNEAGLGTSSIVSASANTPNPVRQGLVAMTATFWDTVVMCLVTGVVIVSSVMHSPAIDLDTAEGGVLCYLAFGQIPYIGKWMLVFSMITFAFSTILGWSCVGESCARYIFGAKVRKPYLLFWVLAVLIAPLISLEFVWNLADLCNALLAVPNVFALLMLQKEVREQTDRFIVDVDRVQDAEVS